MWPRPLPASTGQGPGQVEKPGTEARLYSAAITAAVQGPPALFWVPQQLLAPCPGQPLRLHDPPPRHTHPCMYLALTPQAEPSGCGSLQLPHCPASLSPSPGLHFLPVTKPCGFSIPLISLILLLSSGSHHRGAQPPPTLTGPSCGGRQRAEGEGGPGLISSEGVATQAQLSALTKQRRSFVGLGAWRAGSAVRPRPGDPLSSYNYLKSR